MSPPWCDTNDIVIFANAIFQAEEAGEVDLGLDPMEAPEVRG